MPRGQKQQSMEKIVRPRWSLGGSATKLSSLSLSVEVTSLCKTQVGFCDHSQDHGWQACGATGSVCRLLQLGVTGLRAFYPKP